MSNLAVVNFLKAICKISSKGYFYAMINDEETQ